ncbi:hypothetical protein ACFST9_19310 [Hymenobacter monticola]|uniref:Lipocalin-like domain-containing protein n=1 Tax=Hymenobacter monticola TaxID=1705399 RepID=A0ABY4B1N7_9BACT|nr:hypothetical protein [Hymenobacter monticola]UOE31946.1 hypothetical protein MTP16_12455 [Hymenobacter monticola]
MKHSYHHYALFLLLTASGLAGCSKGAVSPEDQKADLLVGRWQLTQTDGGLTGQVHPADPAQRQEIVFDDDKQATFLLNGAVSTKAKYVLFKANSFVNRRPQTFLAYGRRNGSEKEFIERLSPNELVIVEDYTDGRGYYYTRR